MAAEPATGAGVRETEVELAGQGGDPVRARLFEPPADAEDADGRAVLLVHEVYGADHHMASLGRRFAAAGFPCLLPDLYSREGTPGPESTDAEPAPAWELDTIRAAVAALPDRRALADLDAGLAYLGTRPDVDPRSLAAVGFCMGGTLAFLLGCTSTRIGAVVEFYGAPVRAELTENHPFQPVGLALNLDRPFLGFFGEDDPHVPLAGVEHLRETLAAASKDFEIVTYPGAGHGFFNDARAGHHPEAAADAWTRTLTFLRESL